MGLYSQADRKSKSCRAAGKALSALSKPVQVLRADYADGFSTQDIQ